MRRLESKRQTTPAVARQVRKSGRFGDGGPPAAGIESDANVGVDRQSTKNVGLDGIAQGYAIVRVSTEMSLLWTRPTGL
jgi:hypothetical protein